MDSKKGFTLVELLAVIAILAILLLLITPSIITMFNEGREEAFVAEVQNIYRVAEQEYTQNLIDSKSLKRYFTNESITGLEQNKLSTGETGTLYYVHLNNSGYVDKIAVANNNYCYAVNSDVTINITREDISNYNNMKLECTNTNGIIDCSCVPKDSNQEVQTPVQISCTVTRTGEHNYSADYDCDGTTGTMTTCYWGSTKCNKGTYLCTYSSSSNNASDYDCNEPVAVGYSLPALPINVYGGGMDEIITCSCD